MGSSNVRKVFSTCRSDLDILYHSVTFMSDNCSQVEDGQWILKCDVEYRDTIRKIIEGQSLIKEPQTEIHGNNNKKYVNKRIRIEFRTEFLLKMTYSLKYMHEKDVTHGNLDSSCIYLSTGQKQLAIIGNHGTGSKTDDLKCLAKVFLFVLSDGRITDYGVLPNKTFEELKSENHAVGASNFLAVICKLWTSLNNDLKSLETPEQTVDTITLEKMLALEHDYLTKMNSLSHFLKCKEPMLAYDIIIKMYEDNDFEFNEILSHPFFWPAPKKCTFMYATFENYKFADGFKEGYKETYDNILRMKYRMNKANVFSEDNWFKDLDIRNELKLKEINEGTSVNIITKECVKNNSKVKSHRKESLYDLMRCFRNRFIHFSEDRVLMKAFENGFAGLWMFFASRYPCFLYHVYTKMWSHLKKLPDFDGYTEFTPESNYLVHGHGNL